ncbi:putative bifunctional diguanylate cyclase/phosphodiesterase [Pilimelia columellifera]|uniref:Cyclic Di-GMP phosphodiesterase RmdA n=1 Tax=Pilimelia columellifera subsp. columellifera TaxID=706583 RepID=A0ABP6AEZ7_9ACTN
MATRADGGGGPSWSQRLPTEWARRLSATTYTPLRPPELRGLLTALAADLETARGSADAEASLAEWGRRAGATLVDAHLTDPAALETSLLVLGERLTPGPPATAAAGAFARGFTTQLRAATLREQERLAQAIIRAQSGVERAARQSEARFRAIFAGAGFGIGISDMFGRIIQVNQAFADLLGYPVEEMRGMTIPELRHPSDPARMWEDYRRVFSGEVDHIRMEKAYYRRDGDVVWTELSVSVIRDDAGEPQFTVAMVDDVTERHHLQARLRHQAAHDPLTGLPNRSLFTERLADAIANAGPTDRIGVCYLDLDGFKRINDSLGHDVGDELLVAVAGRLSDCARAFGHLAARMGGDEFVILVERCSGPDQLEILAEAALTALTAPISLGAHRLRVGASIGVVEQPAAATEPAEIMKAADVTLYQAKAAGRGRWVRYDPAMVAEESARYALSADMPDALERGEFTLVYQPIVALPGQKLLGLEALVRWRHPELGLLPPDRFIALAEETGFIVPLGRHVLRQACRQAAVSFPDHDLFVSVNLSVAQTQEDSLVSDIGEALVAAGLPASRLQLELTESALMSPHGAGLRALRTLADGGVRVAIDDFGTGYSNLAYLRSLPVHTLKLPRPFIAGLDQAEQGGAPAVEEQIVDALVRLAHAIDLTVTAEGVETYAQAQRLSALGCDTAQGWFLGPAYPPEQLRRLAVGQPATDARSR